MNKTILLVMISCLFFIPCASCFASVEKMPKAVNGQFNASDWNFTEQGILVLDGEWQFYWNALLDPGDFAASLPAAAQPQNVTVPHVWGVSPSINPAPVHEGYATYRLIVNLGAAEHGTVKALYIPGVASAYKLWVNGRQVDGNGTVGTSRETMKPKTYAKVILFQAQSGSNELIIQVSNFVQRTGGLWSHIKLGNESEIMMLREKNIVFQVSAAIGLFTLGAYHLGLFTMRKNDILSLMIGLCCALVSLRTLLHGDTLLVRFWPGFDWGLAMKLQYLAPYMGIPLFSWYVHKLYPAETNRKVIHAILMIGALFSLLVVLVPARVFTKSIQPFQLFAVLMFMYLVSVFFKAAMRKRKGAWLNGAGALMMFAAMMIDALYYNQWIVSVDVAAVGVFVFLFMHTVVVSLKNRERAEELEKSNARLREANEHLQARESSRLQIITNISHELGTPMTAVQGYIQALLDGVIQAQDRKYISMIYDKVLIVNRLIRDLFDLSKLESGAIKFQTCDVVAEELFELYFREFQYDVEKNGIRFEMEGIFGLPSDRLALLSIDPVRIQQAVGNMIYNAIKFTEPGGLIRISGEFMQDAESEEKGSLLISISDTGIGIEPEAVPRIFERFYQGSVSRGDKSEGTGLGLAIAKEIVNYYGGTIQVESEMHKGSTFRFSLPVELLSLEVE